MRSEEVALPEWLGRTDLTMEELVETAEALVGRIVPKQTKYKVTERPDARTIRYYVTQGLLPKPVGYEGGRARYSGSHLLRLVWIKKLQAEHHTLARISKLLEGASDETVLREIGVDAPAPATVTEEKEAAAEATAAPAPEGFAITPDVLADPVKRVKLAESLEQLAAWLRNMK